MRAKELLKRRYMTGIGAYLQAQHSRRPLVANRASEKYAQKYLKYLGERGYVLRAEVIKVDKQTLKHTRYPVFMPSDRSEEEVLKFAMKAANLGDFLILGEKTFRRIRGGWRTATDEDLAELIGSQL
jgi:hypothetical protein